MDTKLMIKSVNLHLRASNKNKSLDNYKLILELFLILALTITVIVYDN